MSDPASLIGAIDADALALDEASKQLREISTSLVGAAIEYQDAEDVALRDVEADYDEAGKKLPSERQRLAHARPRIDAAVRRRYTELETRRKLIREWADIRQSALMARQSELKALQAEARAPEPQWSRR